MRTISDWLAVLGGGLSRPRTLTLETECDSRLSVCSLDTSNDRSAGTQRQSCRAVRWQKGEKAVRSACSLSQGETPSVNSSGNPIRHKLLYKGMPGHPMIRP